MPNILTPLRKLLPKSELDAIDAWLTTFLPYQVDWILDPADNALYVKARQIGISHATAAVTVLWAILFGDTTTVISIGKDEAKEVLNLAFRHARVLQALGSELANCKRIGGEIKFDNGGRVIARPSSSAGRGFSGNVFLDEFAYVKNPQEVWDGATAVTTHGYKMRVCSTPNGVGNAFHSLVTNPARNEGWKIHNTNIHQAVAQGSAISVESCRIKAKNDPRVFAQLYECSFLDGNEQYIPTKLVTAAQATKEQFKQDWHADEGEYYAGYDVGLQNDLSVLTILRQDPKGRVWVHEVVCGKRTDWQAQKAAIFNAFTLYPIKKLCVDASGVGHGLVSELTLRLGRQKIEGVVFTLQSKEELATDMYQAFATGMIKIPPSPILLQDIVSIRRVITTNGNVVYNAPHNEDGHADRAWSLALAIHACTNRPGARVAMGPGDFNNT